MSGGGGGESIRREIERFESVHPCIYSLYELIETLSLDAGAKSSLREHVIQVEDSFVNSQEWTLAKSVRQLRVCVHGAKGSGKIQFVHRYLTQAPSFTQDEESIEDGGGRYKKEVFLRANPYLLLIRDEVGDLTEELLSWAEGYVLLTNSSTNPHLRDYTERIRRHSPRPTPPIAVVRTDSCMGMGGNGRSSDWRTLPADLFVDLTFSNPGVNGRIEDVFLDLCSLILTPPPGPLPMEVRTTMGPPSTPSTSSTTLGEGTPKSGRRGDGGTETTPSSRRKSHLFQSSSKYKPNSGRRIPKKMGYLYKKANHLGSNRWKKKFVTLDPPQLTYHHSMHDFMENQPGKGIQLQKVSLKVNACPRRGVANRLSEAISNMNLMRHGVTTPDKGVHQVQLLNYSDGGGGGGGGESSTGGKSENGDAFYGFSLVSMDNKTWEFETGSEAERDDWVGAIQGSILALLQGNTSAKAKTSADPALVQSLRTLDGNESCADCGAPNPSWASLNFAILICIECSGIHRNLGSHLSRVKSLDLDEWSFASVEVMSSVGNRVSNAVYEHSLPVEYGVGVKPTPDAPHASKENFIRAKYVERRFLRRGGVGTERDKTLVNLRSAIADKDVESFVEALAEAKAKCGTGTLDSAFLALAIRAHHLVFVQLLLWNNVGMPKDLPPGLPPDIQELLLSSK